jgi:uncharacterized membrane protein (UPF0127 family)
MKVTPLICSLLSIYLLLACNTNDSPTTNQANTHNNSISFKKQGEFYFLNESDTIKKIEIETAESQEKITQGLMHRTSMQFNQGMLFLFEQDERRSFWMKNTYIPLDIIYINSQLKIVSISENTQPLSTQSIPSAGPAQYVLEVNAGFCKTYSIVPGQSVDFIIF